MPVLALAVSGTSPVVSTEDLTKRVLDIVSISSRDAIFSSLK
jgi:hypothetical protein